MMPEECASIRVDREMRLAGVGRAENGFDAGLEHGGLGTVGR